MTRRRLILLVLLVTALLAIVALAAGGRPLGTSGGTSTGLPTVFWDYAFTTVVIVVFIMVTAALLAYAFMGHDRGEPKPFQRRTAKSLATLLVVVVMVALVGPKLRGWLRHHHRLTMTATTSTIPSTTTNTTRTNTTRTITSPHRRPDEAPEPAASHFKWPEFAVVLGLLLVLGGLAAVRSHRRSGLGWRQTAPEVLASALDESLDDLRAEPDLRLAIVAAYARMETVLGAAGVPRRPAEAPLEYVERALLALDTSAAAVRRLTDLFEWARFSHHEPEPAMRDEAIDALVAVRDELRASERVPA